jgi:hypothetical protein
LSVLPVLGWQTGNGAARLVATTDWLLAAASSIAKEWHRSVLFQDIAGSPFRRVELAPGWRTEASVGLARGICADLVFDLLPVLADALEDAGCADSDILAHCRGDGPHVRGCWVVDLVLGKG